MFVGEPEFPVTQDPLTFANTLRALVRTLLSIGDMNPVTCLAGCHNRNFHILFLYLNDIVSRQRPKPVNVIVRK